MRVALLTIPLTLALLLAGCSQSPDAPIDSPSTTPAPLPDGEATPAEPAALVVPVELFNGSIEFAAPTSGPGTTGDFVVPATHGNLTVSFRILFDCPGGFVPEQPHLILTDPSGTEIDLWGYGMVAPAETYSCPVNDQMQGNAAAVYGEGAPILDAIPGTWTLSTTGQVTARAEIVVTATA